MEFNSMYWYRVDVNRNGDTSDHGAYLFYENALEYLKRLVEDDILSNSIADFYEIYKYCDGVPFNDPVFSISYSGIKERLSKLLD